MGKMDLRGGAEKTPEHQSGSPADPVNPSGSKWIQFRGHTSPVRLSDLSFRQQIMLENGHPFIYVSPPDDNMELNNDAGNQKNTTGMKRKADLRRMEPLTSPSPTLG